MRLRGGSLFRLVIPLSMYFSRMLGWGRVHLVVLVLQLLEHRLRTLVPSTCKDYVSRLSAKKMGNISQEYRLRYLPHWATGDERPHLPPPGYMAISEVILNTKVFLPFHPFIEQVLEFFDIVPFQLSPNSYRLIVVFYITFSELCKIAPIVGHFVFIFGLKALVKHSGFWYLTGQTAAAGILGLPIIVGQWKNDFFLYPSNHFGRFRRCLFLLRFRCLNLKTHLND